MIILGGLEDQFDRLTFQMRYIQGLEHKISGQRSGSGIQITESEKRFHLLVFFDDLNFQPVVGGQLSGLLRLHTYPEAQLCGITACRDGHSLLERLIRLFQETTQPSTPAARKGGFAG